MRKLILAALLVLPALCHANSVQIGTLQYIGNSQFQVTITAPWVSVLEGVATINSIGLDVNVTNMIFSGAFCKCQILTAGYVRLHQNG